MLVTLKRRFYLTLVLALVASLVGAAVGYRLARIIAARTAEAQLEQYATRIIADREASSSELRTVLAAVGASRYHPCSNDELGFFRALIFESDFLKDAGRIHDGKIQCSAALGALAQPLQQAEPDFTQQDGTIVYRALTPYRNGDLTTIAMQLGDSFVVFTPFTRMHLEPRPMHFMETATDAPTQKTGRLLGDSSEGSAPILTAEGPARIGDNLYSTHCSIRFFSCATAYTSLDEIVTANRGKFSGCIILCALAGGLISISVSLLYRRNKSVEQQLRRAIAKDKLRLVYQPILDLTDNRIVGAEALARWTNEDGVAVRPDVFVHIAEERGFVGSITRLVIRHALREFGAILRSHPTFRLSINIAATDLSDAEFLPYLENALKRASVPPDKLSIELTESSTVHHEVATEAISSLRKRGHRVHIDDFGTGYSSLSYLQNLSVDAIKIDRSFTQAIGTESVVVAILPQILAMAEALNLAVIVEGVETEEQANYFANQEQRCLAQGWLFGRPVPAADFQRRLAEEEDRKPGSGKEDELLASAGAA